MCKNTFQKIYLNEITGIIKPIEKQLGQQVFIQSSVITQDVYFHKMPRKFLDWFILEFINMNKQNRYFHQVDIRQALSLISIQQTLNFKDFYGFLQILKNSSQKILTLQLSDINSFTQPLSLYEFSDFAETGFKQNYRKKLSQKIPQNIKFSNALQLMKTCVDEITEIGKITISKKQLNDIISGKSIDNYDSLIGHQIRYFLIFLQRWSQCNYEICRKNSEEYLRTVRNPSAVQKYFLDSNEFIALSATYIERLMNLFQLHKRNEIDEFIEFKQLLRTVFVIGEIYSQNLLNGDFYWTGFFRENQQLISVVEFFKQLFNQHRFKFKNNIKTKKDKFLIINKWCLNQFQKRI